MSRRIRVLCGSLPVLAFTVAATALPSVASAHHARHHHRNATNQSDAAVQRAVSKYKARLTADILYVTTQSQRPPSAGQARGVSGKLSGVQRDMSAVQRTVRGLHPSSGKTRRALSDVNRALGYIGAAAGQERNACNDVLRHRSGPARSALRSATTDITRAIPLLEGAGRTLHLLG